ncbi:MAG: hypothetical protein WCT45_02115, partial [Candidatus Paceibacterota bacterium]
MDTRNPLPASEASADAPKKYIRTFAGDMQTLSKGGVPNLEPLATPEATPAPQAPTTAPSAAPALAAPAPVLEQVSVHEAAPAGTPLKTYSGDFSDRIKTMGATTA